MAKVPSKEKYDVQNQGFSAAYMARVGPACHEGIKGFFFF